MIHSVTSRANSRVKMAISLEKPSACRKRNRFIMEGPRFISDHISRNGLIDFVVVSDSASKESVSISRSADHMGIVVIQVPDEIFTSISNTETPQGISAICPIPEHNSSDLFAGGTVLVLDGVADPGNAGTAIRSAAAFGCSGVVFLKGCCFPFSPKVTRSAAGLNSVIPIISLNQMTDINKKHSDYCFLGAQANGVPLDKVEKNLTKPVCLIIGSEAHGLSDVSVGLLSDSISIPMTTGVESLNAGVSASIILSQLFKKKS